MKQCPVCGTSYTDETLRFCLADGAVLTDLRDDEVTEVIPGNDPIRITIAEHDQPTVARTAALPTAQPPARTGGVLKLFVAVLGLGFLLLIVLGVAGIFWYVSNRPVGETNNNSSSNTLRTSPSPTPTVDENEDLRRQIANLEKLLRQQGANRPANIPLTLPNQTSTSTARVNSPGDGFLALRTFPSSASGERILQIPHGASVTVGGCLNIARIGSRAGRWCRASYGGYSGWVFDAFLTY